MLSEEVLAGIRELQDVCHAASGAKGFHDDYPDRADFIPGDRGDRAYTTAVQSYHGNKMMLVVGEVSEAHEELRHGKAPDFTYYPTASTGVPIPGKEHHFKPEGIPSEIADTVIRCFDYAGIGGIDLAAIIQEKLAYNASRPAKHGKKF